MHAMNRINNVINNTVLYVQESEGMYSYIYVAENNYCISRWLGESVLPRW